MNPFDGPIPLRIASAAIRTFEPRTADGSILLVALETSN